MAAAGTTMVPTSPVPARINAAPKNVSSVGQPPPAARASGLLVAAAVAVLVVAHSAVQGHAASIHTSSYKFQDYLVLLYKGTYVAYGQGRASERDLPECRSDVTEACNLSHRRYWQQPLVERLCRCAGHTPCPLHHYHNNTQVVENGGGGEGQRQRDEDGGTETPLVQHINNRAHLQFCNKGVESSGLAACGAAVGLTVQLTERLKAVTLKQPQHTPAAAGSGSSAGAGAAAVLVDSHTTLHCLCTPPRYWSLLNTTNTAAGAAATARSVRAHQAHRTQQQQQQRNEDGSPPQLRTVTFTYECQQLPRCSSYEPCSEVRPDTYESYYTCSCPPSHLCLVPSTTAAAPPVVNTQRGGGGGPHYTGVTLQGVCTPYSTHRGRGRKYG